MRDPGRIPETLASVERLWRANPDQRLGQLLMNACRDLTVTWPDIWNVEDDVLLARINDYLERGSW